MALAQKPTMSLALNIFLRQKWIAFGAIITLSAVVVTEAKTNSARQMRYLMGAWILVETECMQKSTVAEKFLNSIAATEKWMSDYDPNSELARLSNRAQQPVKVSAELFAFLSAAQHFYRLTDATIDITLGNTSAFWRQRAQECEKNPENCRPPEPAEMLALQKRSGMHFVRLDPDQETVQFLHPEIQLDPGAIGKGWALDRALEEVLQKNHPENFHQQSQISALKANFAGELLFWSAEPRTWQFSVRNPENPEDVLQEFQVFLSTRLAVSTSGNYARALAFGSAKSGHIYDPQTGMPAKSAVQSATVLSESAAESDAFSTALLVMPEQAAKRWAEKNQIAAFLVLKKEGKLIFWQSPHFRKITTPQTPQKI